MIGGADSRVSVITKEHILEQIRRTTTDNGGQPPGQRRFHVATGIRQSDWLGKYWLRWSDALTEAGFTPNQKNAAFSDTFILRQYADLARELGHLPLKSELLLRANRDPSFPAYNTFLKFGPRTVLHARLAEWAASNGYADVAAICAVAKAPKQHEDLPAHTSIAAVGWVYLLKSGRYYKIGHSNSVGRREREIAIQMPENAVVVHEISTDDPKGIEQYWHRRFSEKRARGEWFSLAASDVDAFKRRKFM